MPQQQGLPARLQNARSLLQANDTHEAALALGDDYSRLLKRFLIGLCDFGSTDYSHWSANNNKPAKLPPWLIRLFLLQEFTVLNDDESRTFCNEISALPQTIMAAKEHWFYRFKNTDSELDHQDFQDLPNLSRRMHDSLLMLKQRKPRVFNPLTGKLSSRVLSLTPDLALLRDTKENVFVCSTPRLFSSSTYETVFILPARKLVLFVDGKIAAKAYGLINHNLSQLLNSDVSLSNYAANNYQTSRLTVADRPLKHLGHYLWNGLSAWETLNQSALYSKADTLVSWRAGDYFGNPFDLYPDTLNAHANRMRIESPEEAITHIIADNSFWLPLYDRHIRRELSDKITSHSMQNAAPDFVKKINTLRLEHQPIILLTLRLGNRMWVEQEAGYIALINAVTKIHPTAAFILDGMNGQNSEQSTHQFMDTDGELKSAQAIRAQVSASTVIINTIGMPIPHSIVSGDAITAFVAPWGTAMTKYKWINNKPGVAYGCIEQGFQGVGIKVFDRFRDDIISAIDIPAEKHSDAGAGNLAGASRRNFNLQWQDIFTALDSLLKAL